MLYNEFIQGTGCRDNADNFKVYKDLEILYMNSDLTKEAIYEYGKKLVNNGLTEKQKAWNADIDGQIVDLKRRADDLVKDIERYKENCKYYEDNCWYDIAETWKRDIKWARAELKTYRNKIKDLKSCKYS